jgi:hypothetical protein
MSSTFNSLTNNTLHTPGVPFVIVSDKAAKISATGNPNTQQEEHNDRQNDFAMLRYLLRQNCVTLHSLEKQQPPSQEEGADNRSTKPLIYNSTLSRNRTLRMIMYKPQVLMANIPINFVGFVSQKQKTISEKLEQELLRLDTILVEELTQMSGLLSYASLHTTSGTWYNLVLMNDDQVRSYLKQGAHHQYAAYHLAPHYYEWVRIHSGILPGGVRGDRFEVQRTKYYAIHNTYTPEQTFRVYENTYATDTDLVR